MPFLGAHMSIAGGLHKAVEAAAKLGMETVQLFTNSPSQWAVRPAPGSTGAPAWQAREITAEEARKFEESLAHTGLVHPLSHASYLINLASPDEALWDRSVAAFVVELQRAERIGVPYVVLHPGSHTTASEEEGIANVVRALDEVHRRLPAARSRCLLENTAGQGTNLGWRFEHLAAILAGVCESDRLGVCFDTCHAFAAGWEFAQPRSYEKLWQEFDRIVGLERLKAVHLNDSKRELGSRVDRHEHIGEGQLGLAPFRRMLNDERFAACPMYLETEKGERDGEDLDAINLRVLRSLLAERPRRSRSRT